MGAWLVRLIRLWLGQRAKPDSPHIEHGYDYTFKLGTLVMEVPTTVEMARSWYGWRFIDAGWYFGHGGRRPHDSREHSAQ